MTTSASKTAVIPRSLWLAIGLSVGCGSLGGPSLDELNAVHPLPDPTVDETAPDAPFEPEQRRDVADADASFTMRSYSDFIEGITLPGDLDGDGIDDLVLHARRGNPPDTVPCDDGCPGFSQSIVYVFYGSPSVGGALVPDATIESWHVNGLRHAVDAAGDVDGDGAADLWVSIGSEGCEQGNVFLVRGGPRLSGTHEVRDVGALVRESGTCARLGEGVGVGDVDGDGLADAVLATPGTERVYFFYGTDEALPGRRSELDADASFEHPRIGRATPVGDVNGDGLGDFVLGADIPNVLSSSRSDHEHWLVLGSRSRLDGALDPSVATTVLVASAVAGVGDVDGDGIDDLGAVVAAGTSDGFVVPGRREWPAVLDVHTSTTFVIRAAPVTVHEPTTIAAAGDVDGDGLADLLYGEPAYDAGEDIPRGAVHLFLGPVTGALTVEGSTTFLGQDWASDHDGGRRGFDRLGRWMAGASDLNGDGLDDLVLPASDAPDGGRVYVWLGRSR